MEKILVYDRSSGGHHLEYLNHIFQELLLNTPKKKYYFLIPGEAKKIIPPTLLQQISFHFLTKKEFEKINAVNGLKQAEMEWELIKKLIIPNNISEILFLDIDRYQFLIGSTDYIKSNISTSGILFRPYARMLTKQSSEKLKYWLTRKRKAIQLKWMLRNKNIKSVFILNDDEVADQLNKNLGSMVFKYLTDPIDEATPKQLLELNEIEDLKGLPPASNSLLVFGTLDNRKNIPNILKAFEQLDTTQLGPTNLLICGKCNFPAIETAIVATKNKLEKTNPDLKIRRVNRFLSTNEMHSVYKNATAILIPYIKFFFSSGILGYATLYNTPVIASDNGIIGRLVKQYNVGEVVEATNAKAIQMAMEKILTNKNDIDGREFVRNHKVNKFTNILLNQA